MTGGHSFLGIFDRGVIKMGGHPFLRHRLAIVSSWRSVWEACSSMVGTPYRRFFSLSFGSVLRRLSHGEYSCLCVILGRRALKLMGACFSW